MVKNNTHKYFWLGNLVEINSLVEVCVDGLILWEGMCRINLAENGEKKWQVGCCEQGNKISS